MTRIAHRHDSVGCWEPIVTMILFGLVFGIFWFVFQVVA